MIFLKDSDVRSLLKEEEYIDAIEEAYAWQGRGEMKFLQRKTLWYGDQKSVKVMVAASCALGFGGSFLYTGGYDKKEAPKRVFTLFDTGTGVIKAIMQAEWLSWLRTGGTSAVASKYLAKRDASIVGIIGSGKQAFGQLSMLTRVLQLQDVRVFSRGKSNREEFVGKVREELGSLEVRDVSHPRDAVEGADVVVLATNSKRPVIDAAWLSPGVHV